MSSSRSRLPRDVREAAERADKAHQALIEAPGHSPPGTPEPEEPQAETAPAEVLAEEEAPAEAPAEAEGFREQRESAAETVGMEELSMRLLRAEQEARTWKGRHAADTSRLSGQLEELSARLAELEKSGPPENGASFEPTSEDVEAFGPDLLAMVRRIASGVAHGVASETEKRLFGKMQEAVGKVDRVQAVTEETRRERFFSELDRTVPYWRKLDEAPAFLAWLGEYDPFLRSTRKEALDTAAKALDAVSVAAFVERYASEHPEAVAGSQSGRGTARETPPTALDDMASPARSRNVGPRELMSKGSSKIWTRGEIARVYRDIGRGLYRDKGAERKALEAEIAKAMAEQRVTL